MDAPPPADVALRGRQQEDSDDGSSDDEGAIGSTAQPQNVPQPPPGALHPSVGSERHAIGACRRCCFFPRGRCMNGYDCEFCHYDHDKRKRKNKTKKRVEAAMMKFAPRATMHAPPLAFGVAAAMHRNWAMQTLQASHPGFPAMLPTSPTLAHMSMMGHRHADASVAFT